MAQGVSVHFGVQSVDPTQYVQYYGTLDGPVNDARVMYDIAKGQGFVPVQVLLNQNATAGAVLTALKAALATITDGDILLLTYSGHGDRIPDASMPGNNVDTWCLYDRMLLSHELAALWPLSRVRVILVSDSCHSGTIGRKWGKKAPSKALPPNIALATYRAHQNMYDAIAIANNPAKVRRGAFNVMSPINQGGASIILMGACQDNQEAQDGSPNSVFTANLKAVWDNGQFQTYANFVASISALMPQDQTPSYLPFGYRDPAFEASRPFAI
ncbi:hypothetical protein AYO40_00260 [Planctomycetaceae bacterium SCGC AG-212-D15]|nr:hypothetical protein AYO40_00260 [Planctomycetaceae bacterium SCGC AG-212-D15]